MTAPVITSLLLLGLFWVSSARHWKHLVQDGEMLSSKHLIKRSPGGGLVDLERHESVKKGKQKRRETKIKPNEECGVQHVQFTPPEHSRMPRIRNGTCAPYGSLPWTAQIQIINDGDYMHHCGGTIISENYILTASHCFGSSSDYGIMKVVVGQDGMGVQENKEMGFQIEKVFRHKNYQSEGPYSHDIALIKLKSKGDGRGIRFSPEVQQICLPNPEDKIKDDLQCVISGWGKTDPSGPVRPDCLRAATIPIINQDKCEKMYTYFSQGVLKNMVCAGYTEGGVDACKGDSGGPLSCLIDGSYKLVGIVSWGHGCGQANKPGVFTRVQSFLDWIENKME
ncbi:cationic trypsin [Eurytemora carolleeae]|uniref:cationic trypsin n=1 Tax=Eurytemora carolleeae TaxID=1294199 RepID=UPI000C7650B4|nr:cationic trypsin [Eurytemora carolleeae]|eukprot:XP_023325019.1 cationic trypsin-like [Eurytemora affinis]